MMSRSFAFALLCAASATALQAHAAGQAGAPAAAVASATTTATTAPAAVVVSSATPGPVADKLIITDVKVGTGKEAMAGAQVSVNYTGWLYRPLAKNSHGRQFDTSVGRGPFDFALGRGQVIKGWDQGVQGMKVGGKRTLIIPSELAYGARAQGDIPSNSNLIFEVELLDVK